MPTKSAALQQQINSLDLAIQQGASDAQLNLWEMQRKELNDQLTAALADEAQHQERVQAQTDAVESIQLPYDYNDLFGHPDANDNIIAVVKQFQLQAYADHNAEVARIKEDHKNNVDTLYARHTEVTEQFINDKNDLQRRLDMENEQAKKDAIELMELNQQVAQLGLEKQDAELKRDNAIRQLENVQVIVAENEALKEQIEALKQELMAKKAISVDSNDKLAELANKAKESTIAKANRGLARWGMDEIPTIHEIPTITVGTIEPVSEVVEPVTELPFPIQAVDSGTTEETIRNESMEQVVAKESEVITLESLHERVKALESKQAA